MRYLLLGFLPLLLLTACFPGASDLVKAPSFELIPEGSGLVSVDPPGVGNAEARFRLNLRVRNPNSFGLQLAGLDGAFIINDRLAAQTEFRDGLVLTAGGVSQLSLDIAVPLTDGLALLTDITGLIIGKPTRYQIDAVVILDVFGQEQRLPSVTLVSASLNQAIALNAPSIRLNAADSALSVSLSQVVFDLALEIDNPLIVGYQLSAPELGIRLGNTSVGDVSLVNQAVPALGTAKAILRFETTPASLGLSLVNTLQSGGVDLSLSGAFSLVFPGINQTFSQEISGLLP